MSTFFTIVLTMIMYLNNHPPNGLHRHCDEWDNGVSKGEVENQEVNICPTLHLVPARYNFSIFSPPFFLDA